MISLRNRLLLTYALFTSASLGALAFAVNLLSEKIFESFVIKNIETKSMEIAASAAEQYLPFERAFDIPKLETAGMLFMHDGFIIDVENMRGETVWNARSMNMEHCVAVLQKIEARMRGHGLRGQLQNKSFDLTRNNEYIGAVNIASVGPFFYTESQSEFISALNTLMLFAALVCIALSVCISLVLAASLARPIHEATSAARKIAAHYAEPGTPRGGPEIALKENYRTSEFAELARAINKMAKELSEALRRQKQLIGDAAHELRTPLTSIQGTIEAFLDGVWESSPTMLRSLLDEVQRLTKLVEDLQVLSSFESGFITLYKTEFDMADLVQSAVDQLKNAALEKGLVLTANDCDQKTMQLMSAPVFADYDRTKQVMINLLSNAVKYTEQGAITVSIKKTSIGNKEKIMVIIADAGQGISKEDLPHIFERFYRAEKSRNRETGGAGVGLTIAAAICAAHEWEIGAESEEGKGSIFTVTLNPSARQK